MTAVDLRTVAPESTPISAILNSNRYQPAVQWPKWQSNKNNTIDMIALHQNVANCQNTPTVLTRRWIILLQDI